jgi:lipoyl(octanoyl) transferase
MAGSMLAAVLSRVLSRGGRPAVSGAARGGHTPWCCAPRPSPPTLNCARIVDRGYDLVKFADLLENSSLRREDGAPVLWRVSLGDTAYPDALAQMEARVAGIRERGERELVWLLEHPPIYTAGTSAAPGELLAASRFPVYEARRGGRYTYHGPGQRVVYVMLDLKRRRPDVRAFVRAMQGWVIDALAELGVRGEAREGRVGVWVRRPEKGPQAEDKIASIGVRLRGWVSSHGFSLNVAPNLEHFSGIVPCGISGHGVTSLEDLGLDAAMSRVDAALLRSFERRFGAVAPERDADSA